MDPYQIFPSLLTSSPLSSSYKRSRRLASQWSIAWRVLVAYTHNLRNEMGGKIPQNAKKNKVVSTHPCKIIFWLLIQRNSLVRNCIIEKNIELPKGSKKTSVQILWETQTLRSQNRKKITQKNLSRAAKKFPFERNNNCIRNISAVRSISKSWTQSQRKCLAGEERNWKAEICTP